MLIAQRFNFCLPWLIFFPIAFLNTYASEQNLIEKAGGFEKEKAYVEAEKIWESLLKKEPTNPTYLYKLGRVYAFRGRYEEAEKLLKRSLQLNPKEDDTLLILAQLYLWTHREREAKELFVQILQRYPNYEDAQRGLTQAERVISDNEKKEKEEKNLAKEHGIIEKAEKLEKKKDYSEEIILWKYLLKEQPENAYYLYRLGRVYAWSEHYEEAENLLNHALKLTPKDADVQLALANVYFWSKREEKARELFLKILKEHPTYEDAKKALKKIEESLKEREEKAKKEKEAEQDAKKGEKKESEFEPWQKAWVTIAEYYEKKKCYNKALEIWIYLFNSSDPPLFQSTETVVNAVNEDPQKIEGEKKEERGQIKSKNRHIFAFQIGKVLSWKEEWDKARMFLQYALSMDRKYEEAWLRLGYVALFSGQLTWSKQIFGELLYQNSKKPDPDVVEAYGRACQALLDNLEARQAYCVRFHEPKPTFSLLLQYHNVLRWTNPWIRGVTLYSQERETDLPSLLTVGQLNIFFAEATYYYPLTDTMRLNAYVFDGTEREINLSARMDNYFVLEWKYGIGYDQQINPWLTLRSWCTVKQGRDIGMPLFPFGVRTRFEPGIVLLYNRLKCSAVLSAIRDSFIEKKFEEQISTFLPKDTCLGQIEYGVCNQWLLAGLLGYCSFYHDSPFNHQWEGQTWVTCGYPKYEPCLFVHYKGRVSGFKSFHTDYYSYSCQWEHFAKIFFVKETTHNTVIEAGYHRSWQWSRNLNQPVTSTTFIPRFFRITNKAYLEFRYLYRPNLNLTFRSEYYKDTSRYAAWSTRGEINLVF